MGLSYCHINVRAGHTELPTSTRSVLPTYTAILLHLMCTMQFTVTRTGMQLFAADSMGPLTFESSAEACLCCRYGRSFPWCHLRSLPGPHTQDWMLCAAACCSSASTAWHRMACWLSGTCPSHSLSGRQTFLRCEQPQYHVVASCNYTPALQLREYQPQRHHG